MTEPTLSFGSQNEGASRYLTALREHWLLILTLVVISVGSAAIVSLTAAKKYEAEAQVLVNPVSEGDATFVGVPVIKESSGLTSGVLTAARLIQTPEIAEGVRTRYGFHMGRSALLGSISVKPLSQSNIIAIVATSGTPRRAAAIANAFAVELVRQRTTQFQTSLNESIARLQARLSKLTAAQLATPSTSDLQGRLSELVTLAGGPDPTLHVVSRAVPPTSASWPRPKLAIAVALLVALLLGAGAALALEVFNPRINREDELLLGHRLPILARVPRVRNTAASRYLTRRGKLPVAFQCFFFGAFTL
jgi:capsular polysaccharide biosynthesis protein